MKQLQKWFDLLAGISAEEQRRLALAHAIFSQTGPDIAELSIPTCWRRKRQIRVHEGMAH